MKLTHNIKNELIDFVFLTGNLQLSKNYQYEVICMKFFTIDSLIEVNGNQYFACISQSIQATILGRKNHF